MFKTFLDDAKFLKLCDKYFSLSTDSLNLIHIIFGYILDSKFLKELVHIAMIQPLANSFENVRHARNADSTTTPDSLFNLLENS